MSPRSQSDGRRTSRPILTTLHLEQFELPRTWSEILNLAPRLSSSRWRKGVVEADKFGSGLLTWLRSATPRGQSRAPSERRERRGAWVLSEKGRDYVARECREGRPMSKLIETIRTTPTMRTFSDALLVSWPDATKEGAGVLWSHFAGETAGAVNGKIVDGHHCYNHNLGNVKWSKGCGLDYVSLKGVWEGFRIGDEDGDGDIDEVDRVMLIERLVRTGLWAVDPSADHAKAVGPGKVSMVATSAHSATWFRAYPNLAVGMDAFVRMKRDPSSRYAGSWRFVEAGDPNGYARELGAKGYYTASPDVYAAAMMRKFAVWMAAKAFDEAAASSRTLAPGSYRVEEPAPIVHAFPDTTPIVIRDDDIA